MYQIQSIIHRYNIQYCALAGGGKGTCEPSQLTAAKSQTQHQAHPLNDDDHDDDDGGGGYDDDHHHHECQVGGYGEAADVDECDV